MKKYQYYLKSFGHSKIEDLIIFFFPCQITHFLYSNCQDFCLIFFKYRTMVIAKLKILPQFKKENGFPVTFSKLILLSVHLGFLLPVRSQLFLLCQGQALNFVANCGCTLQNTRKLNRLGVKHNQKHLCFVPIYIFIHIWVWEDGRQIPQNSGH